ncbi:hypothetical protein DS885_03810 [Psychromonas sp. B3M02]|uniref:hypothetical protein n=1 Tax=Psychromonas sp. B3M02 TaxID=2267226 RepID=UPI000DE93F03|nr:hypothetical protein [Psychromonas sp. B3M02]RBW47282.1 hypothetical protein DS885_03810 [Psychromonas sp. B3M02]
MKILIFTLSLAFSLNAFSATTKTEELTLKNSSIEVPQHSVNKSTKNAWGLTISDMEKYQKVVNGPRGTFSPGIAPPLALALEAEDLDEKKHYLSIYADLVYDSTEKDLATSQLYREIFNQKYPQPIINTGLLFENNENYIKPTDRFVVFISPDCADCSGKLLNDLITTANFPKNPTDIYVSDLNEDELNAWANKSNIKVKDVQLGKVTLNIMPEIMKIIQGDKDYAIYISRDDLLFDFVN